MTALPDRRRPPPPRGRRPAGRGRRARSSGTWTACERCRQRLDALADVTAVGVALAAAGRPGPGLGRPVARLMRPPRGPSRPTGPPARGRPGPCRPTDRPGFIGRLGGIEIRRVIGRGGMGVVYEGLDPALNRPVAVKVLSPHLLGDGAAARAVPARGPGGRRPDRTSTSSPSTPSTRHDGVPFLVLQYVAGESLADRLARDGRLPVDEVARIGGAGRPGAGRGPRPRARPPRRQAGEHAARRRRPGCVRLTDFGLAKLVGGDDDHRGRGRWPGRPAYMSPEQAAGGTGGRPVRPVQPRRRPVRGRGRDAAVRRRLAARGPVPDPRADADPAGPAGPGPAGLVLFDRRPAAGEGPGPADPDGGRGGGPAGAPAGDADRAGGSVRGPRPRWCWSRGGRPRSPSRCRGRAGRPRPGRTAGRGRPTRCRVPPGFVVVGPADHFQTLGEAVNGRGRRGRDRGPRGRPAPGAAGRDPGQEADVRAAAGYSPADPAGADRQVRRAPVAQLRLRPDAGGPRHPLAGAGRESRPSTGLCNPVVHAGGGRADRPGLPDRLRPAAVCV